MLKNAMIMLMITTFIIVYFLVGVKAGYINTGKKKSKDNLKLFEWLSKRKYLSEELKIVYESIYYSCNYSKEETKKISASLLIKNLMISLGSTILMHLILKNMLVDVVFIYLFFNLLNRRYRDEVKKLGELINSVDKLQTKYKENNGIVDATIESAIDVAKPSAKRDLDGIYTLVRSKDKSNVAVFKQKVQNKFMRMLGTYLLLINEEGDEGIDGKSTFYKNTSSILREMRNEYRKTYNIKQNAHYEKVFIILPIFIYKPLKLYSLNIGSSLRDTAIASYFDSYWGTMAFIIMISSVVGSYLIYESFIRSDMEKGGRNNKKYEVKLMKNKKVVKFLEKRIPGKGSDKYKRIRQKMLFSGKLEKIEYHYLRKYIHLIIVCTLVSTYILGGHVLTLKKMENSLSYGLEDENMYKNVLIMQGGISSKEEKRIIDQDRVLMQLVNDNSFSEDQLKNYIISNQIKGFLSSKHMAMRVMAKVEIEDKISKDIYFKFIMILLICLVAYNFENFRITFLAKAKEGIYIEDEIMEFQTVILVLMNNKRASVSDCIDNMLEHAVIFYVPLEEARDNMRSKSVAEALMILRNDVDNDKFHDIVDGLILADRDISLYDAFESLREKKEDSQILRRDNTERIIYIRSTVVNQLGRFCPSVTVFFYLGLPIVIAVTSALLQVYTSYQYTNLF